MVYHLDYVALLLLQRQGLVPFCELVSLEIDDELLEVAAVERDYVFLQEVLLGALHLDLNALLLLALLALLLALLALLLALLAFVLLRVAFAGDVPLELSLEALEEGSILYLLEESVAEDECLHALDDMVLPYLLEEVGEEVVSLGRLGLGLRAMGIYVDVDVIRVCILDADVNVDVLAVFLEEEVALGQVHQRLGMRHVVALVDFALLEDFLDLALRRKQSLEHRHLQ